MYYVSEYYEPVHLSHVMGQHVFAYSNNKGEGQPTHLCSLIRAIVIRFLDSVINYFAYQ